MAALQHEELEHLGGAGRYGEMQGDVARCRETWRDAGRCGEMQGDVARCREVRAKRVRVRVMVMVRVRVRVGVRVNGKG